MYLDHFGLNEPPFRITPHTDFFFGGANRGATLDALMYAISHDEGIVKVSGEVGSGKTMLCRVLMDRLPENVETIYLANPSLAPDEILFAIADELKVEHANDRPSRLMRALLDHLIALYADGRRVVVLIDEAHAMPRETLEEVRLLSNLETSRHKLLQIVLFGQPELDQHLNTPQLRQLMDRITHTFRLEPLLADDIERYVDFRMRAAGYRGPNVYSASAIRLIAQASGGLTRRVNILADKSLLAAFAVNAHAVTPKEVRKAIRDSEFYRARRNWRQLAIAAVGIAGGLAIGLGVDFLIREHTATKAGSPLAAPAAAAPKAPVRPVRRPPAPLAKAPPPIRTATSSHTVPPAAGSAGAETRRPPAGVEDATAPGQPDVSTVLADARPQNQNTPASANQASEKTPEKEQNTATTPRQAAGRPADAPATAGAPAPESEATNPATPTPPQGKIVRERFAATQKWLQTAPPEQYSIQLATVRDTNTSELEGFLLSAVKIAPRDAFHVYSVKSGGMQWYRLAYGLYPSIEQARVAMKALPSRFVAGKPFFLSVSRMRSQNRQ